MVMELTHLLLVTPISWKVAAASSAWDGVSLPPDLGEGVVDRLWPLSWDWLVKHIHDCKVTLAFEHSQATESQSPVTVQYTWVV